MIRSLLIFLFFTSCAPVRNGSRLEAVNPVPVPGPSISFVKRFKGHDDTLYRLAVSPTNRDLAISMDQDGHAVLWNLALGTKYWDTLLKLHKHLHAVAFSHDGHWIVAGGRSGVLKILSVETGQVVREFSHPDQIKPLYFTAAFSPDDRFLLTSSGGEEWDHSFGLAYLPHQRELALQSRQHRLMVWNVETGNLVSDTQLNSPTLRNVDFSGDGTMMYAIDHSTVRVFKADGTSVTSIAAKQIDPVSVFPVFLGVGIAPDLRYAAVGTLQGVSVVNMETSNEVLKIPLPLEELPQYLQFSRDRKTLLGIDEKSGVHIWSLTTGERLKKIKDRSGSENFPFVERVHPLVSVDPDFSFLIQPYFTPNNRGTGFDQWKINLE